MKCKKELFSLTGNPGFFRNALKHGKKALISLYKINSPLQTKQNA